MTGPGQADRQVGGHRGLADAALAAGDGDDLAHTAQELRVAGGLLARRGGGAHLERHIGDGDSGQFRATRASTSARTRAAPSALAVCTVISTRTVAPASAGPPRSPRHAGRIRRRRCRASCRGISPGAGPPRPPIRSSTWSELYQPRMAGSAQASAPESSATRCRTSSIRSFLPPQLDPGDGAPGPVAHLDPARPDPRTTPGDCTSRVPRIPTGTIGSRSSAPAGSRRAGTAGAGRRAIASLRERSGSKPRLERATAAAKASLRAAAIAAIDRHEAAGLQAPSRRWESGTGSAWPGSGSGPAGSRAAPGCRTGSGDWP